MQTITIYTNEYSISNTVKKLQVSKNYNIVFKGFTFVNSCLNLSFQNISVMFYVRGPHASWTDIVYLLLVHCLKFGLMISVLHPLAGEPAHSVRAGIRCISLSCWFWLAVCSRHELKPPTMPAGLGANWVWSKTSKNWKK